MLYKRSILLPILLISCIFTVACARDGDELWDTGTTYFKNQPLPVGKKQLKVLAIGNSYTVDAVAVVQDLLKACSLEPASYSIYVATHSAASLQYWSQVAESGELVELVKIAGQDMPLTKGTMAELLAQDWDVVTLQQFSGASIFYATFDPWLRQLIDVIRQCCPNPHVALAWQMAWSYDESYSSYPSHSRWEKIVQVVQLMSRRDGIDIIIPIGTAIQNARNTSLNTQGGLTRDGTHLDMGIGRYIAACTWFQTLFAPVYGTTIDGKMDIPIACSTTKESNTLTPVTEENRYLCQQCALKAVEAPFALSLGLEALGK